MVSELELDVLAACLTKLSHISIAAKPMLLMSSLPNKHGLCWEYLQYLRRQGEIEFSSADQVLTILQLTDASFKATHVGADWRQSPQIGLC